MRHASAQRCQPRLALRRREPSQILDGHRVSSLRQHALLPLGVDDQAQGVVSIDQRLPGCLEPARVDPLGVELVVGVTGDPSADAPGAPYDTANPEK